MNYQRILVPYDGSKFSKSALNEAVKIARNGGGTIYLCTVITAGNVVPPGALMGLLRSASKGELRQRLLKSARAEAEKMLTAQIKHCEKEGVAAQYDIVANEDIALDILGIAKKRKADLIVIGSQGLHGISKIKSLGSVSRKVSEFASCPVLIVR
ncbi:MAG: universal stress protein [Candidatus Nitrosotenuis sp.]|uniref:Putative Universal stress protein YxiE n=1 Tax=Candidatus Nitrosotenuis uzonensis TaxID=1407055 RepID=A0A812EY44_9ARCH|nr:universal stress protein [Candidatus Nitrosotenuis uzonensis]MCA2003511.1 universal stress protein [Candidatus Nitrosotenuis sp.]CAE6487570.1 putative Universal stress protein YxiE [Candidatus Nitrosotenuis uzonensis]